VSINIGGSRTAQTLSELVLQFPTLSFCSLESDKKKAKRKNKKQKHKNGQKAPWCSSVEVSSHSTWASGLFHSLKW
jgi:hypothetical protein